METGRPTSRRRFLCLTGGLAAGVVLPAISSTARAAQTEAAGVNPVEDLMREHGVLRRVLLIYEETADRLSRKETLPPDIIEASAHIIRRYIHDYHEKLEEEEVFPRLQNAGKLSDLIATLTAQHQAGRRLTDTILQYYQPAQEPEPPKHKEKMPAAMEQMFGGPPAIFKPKKRKPSGPKYEVGSSMRQFVRMYRPHAAREDTVLFPALQSMVSPREFQALGEKFENRERELFGNQGFEKMVASVADIEKKLGIYDLSQYT
ncbi:MAG: hemerythrin domain-containing protein [Syntrophobacteraceae bacterium]